MTYQILRVTPNESTITVMLKINDAELQEDIVVDDFMNMPRIEAQIQERLKKFAEDLEAAKGTRDVPVHPDLQGLVDTHTKSFKEESNN